MNDLKPCDYCIHAEMCGWRKDVEEQGCEFYDNGNKWIPCSERLPEDKQRVIIQMYNGNMEIIEFSTIGLTDHILAWMPLPEPYKEEPDD